MHVDVLVVPDTGDPSLALRQIVAADKARLDLGSRREGSS